MAKWMIVPALVAIIAGGLVGCSSSNGSAPAALAQPAAITSAPTIAAPVAPAVSPQPGSESTATSDAELLAALASGSGNKDAAPAVQSDFTANSALTPGDALKLVDNQITLDLSTLGAQAHFYHVALPDGKTVYFFVVKDKNGVIRAAANACQVCFSTKRGFHQEDGWMVCNTCGNRYPLEKIATEKGGCNPVPINPNLSVKGGKATLQLTDLEPIANYF
jgi:hypothetical protein